MSRPRLTTLPGHAVLIICLATARMEPVDPVARADESPRQDPAGAAANQAEPADETPADDAPEEPPTKKTPTKKTATKRPAKAAEAEPKEDADSEDGPADPEVFQVSTTDGVEIDVWYYTPWFGQDDDDAKPSTTATPVILVHDLLGSHESADQLALFLQKSGMAVACPDLRGHGGSRTRIGPDGQKSKLDAGQLRRADLEMVAAVSGGSVRAQADVQGDLEVVRSWLAGRADEDPIDMKRLCVVGSGLGATLAAQWIANDWAWADRPLASGSQGKFVRGFVLVSPVWATKGVSFTPILSSPAFRGGLPILILSGNGDRDAGRLFDSLKRFQPDSWFEQKPGQDPQWARQLEKAADATLFTIGLATPLSADKLMSDPAVFPEERVSGFINLAAGRRGR